ncbi:hypothetical protein [Alkalihalobacillus deserti]|nr:hypothetical protein [Alkalihalobacillus deserti]
MPSHERSSILEHVARLLAEKADEAAEIIATETAKR